MIEKRSIQSEASETKSSKKWILIVLITLLTGGATYTGLAFTVLLPKYTISFNTNGGSIEEPIKFDGKSSINLPSSTKVGYKLDGWYLDNEDYINKVDNDYFIEHNINKNTTLYAKWNLGTFTSLDGTLEYENNGTSVSLTHIIDDSVTEVVIASVIDSLPVNDIGEDAFKDNTKLEKVTIEPGLTYINANAFKGCTSLVQITIPDTVVYIGDYAFENTSLSNLVIPNSVKGIGTGAFQNNALLENITMSTEVSQFSNSLFKNCPSLKTISQNIPAVSPAASLEGADLSTKLSTIGDNVFKDDISLAYINIPSSVSSIGDNAFENIGATSIIIPNSVTKLGKGLFSGSSSLISVTLPSSLTIISEKMFLNCTSLTTINNYSAGGPSLDLSSDSSELTIPDGIVTIERNAFDGCSSIESIKMSNSVTRIEPSAFSNCALLSNIQLSNKLDTIEEYLFANDVLLNTFTIPSNIISLKDHAFSKTSITDLVIPSTVLFISKGSLAEIGNLKTLSSPFIGMARTHEPSAYIGWFFGADSYGSNNDYLPINFSDFTLTSSESIFDHAFSGAARLETINVGTSEIIGDYAFEGCTSLTSMDLKSVKQIGKGILQSTFIQTLSLDFIGSGTNSKTWFGWIFGSETSAENNSYIPSTLQSINYEGRTIGAYAFYGLSKKITINSKYTLDSIGAHAFDSNSSITNIPVPTKVIGDYAFYNCTKLVNISDLNHIETIGNYAFAECNNLLNITLEGIKDIGTYAFKGTSLNDVSLPSTITEIKEGTFEDSHINSITSAATSISIGKYAFRAALLLVELNSTFLTKITTIGESAFADCPKLQNLIFPAVGSKITKIDSKAFSKCPKLQNVQLPTSLNEIGSEIFMGSEKISTLIVPFIGQYASNSNSNKRFSWFYSETTIIGDLNTNITDLTVSNDTTVTTDSFTNVKITNVTYGSRLTTIDRGAFQNSLIEHIYLPNSITIISSRAFQNNSKLLSVSIPAPQSVGHVEDYLFYNSPLITNVIAFTRDRIIPAYAYAKTGVTSISFGSEIREIGEGAFSDCTKLTSIYTKGTVLTAFPTKAFKGCTALQQFVFEVNTITEVGDYAFEGCTSLTGLSIQNTSLKTGVGIVKGCTKLATLEVQSLGQTVATHSDGSLARFFGSTDKTVYIEGLIPNSLTTVVVSNVQTTIPTYGFAYASGLRTVTINPNITEIPNHAFDGDGNLTTIPSLSNKTKIGDYAFKDCKSITSITITSLTSLGSYAFYGCRQLSNVTFPSTVTTIKSNAFNGCEGFSKITLPDTITSVGDYAFYGCLSVTTMTISKQLNTAGKYCFAKLESLTSVTIPDTLNEYPDGLFSGCTNLATITMKKSGQTLFGDYVFKDTKVTIGLIPYSVTKIGRGVFENVKLTEINLPFTGNDQSNTIASNFSWVFGDSAAKGVYTPNTLKVPQTLRRIGCGQMSVIPAFAFSGLINVQFIAINTGAVEIKKGAFRNCTSLKVIGASDKLESADPNVYFEQLLTIEEEAFYGCVSLTAITFRGASLKSVYSSAFTACNSLNITVKGNLKDNGLANMWFNGAKSYTITAGFW